MDFTRLFDIPLYQQSRYPRKVALSGIRDGQWFSLSTEEFVREIDLITTGLHRAGIRKGDKVAVLCTHGTPYWSIADMAMLRLGIITVPIHATSIPASISAILHDSQAIGCWVSDPQMLDKLQDSGAAIKHLLLFPSDAWRGAELPDYATTWDSLGSAGMPTPEILAISETITPDQLATILYTSGTTGQPKGVMLSHANLVSNIKSTLAVIPIGPHTVTLSILPLSHIFERMVTYTYIVAGTSLWYADKTENLPKIFRKVRPHFFTAVPRVVERMYARMMEQRDRSIKPIQMIFDWAIALGMRYPSRGTYGFDLIKRIKFSVANILIYQHLRRGLGGRVEGMVVGAAALQQSLARLFTAAGIPVREGYGLTETSPVLTFNRFEPGGVRFGTVGMALPGVEIRIANPNADGQGEIEVRGPNVMMGYFNRPQDTLEKFTTDGWLKTGDEGKWVDRHFLQITGRISELFKTASGKFTSPQKLETSLLLSPYINQCMVVGLNKPYVGALIVPDFEALERWCKANQVHWTAPQYMVHNPKIEKLIQAEINQLNKQMERNEYIRTFALVHQPWTIDDGSLTPTLKIKRNFLTEKYANEISQMYAKKQNQQEWE